MRGFVISFYFIFLSINFYGCGTVSQKEVIQPEKRTSQKNNKVKAEAYLFDAKLKQNGKPTSVRLFFFQTDSIIAIGGKGYLGKGALKGWMTNDSILVSFPTLQEYLYESVDDLFESFNCSGDVLKFDLMALFSSLPDAILKTNNALVLKLNDNHKHPKFKITFPNCLWKIEVTYDLKKSGHKIRKFFFDDGEGNSFSGKRREYKANSKVPKKHFKTIITPSMTRIIP